jgi:uncharacterized protein YceK
MLKLNRVLSIVLALAVVTPVLATVEGCSSTAAAKKKKKGAGSKGATAAKSSSQKAGSTAANKKDTGTKKGDTLDSVKCDASIEGVAWCDTDTQIILCSAGEWYEVDCAAAVGGVCGDDLESNTIDCYATGDTE